jgi:hypothetical protein
MRLFGFGKSKAKHVGGLSDEQVDLACRLFLGRAPTQQERKRAARTADLDALREYLLEQEDAQRVVSLTAANAEKKPLLLIGFPRGFTSQSYSILQRATGLKEHLSNAGEFLNLQRVRGYFPFVEGRMGFYDSGDDLYEKIATAMEKVPAGTIVKDVVQPFHVLRWLDEHPDRFNVVYVNRNLEHIAFAVMRREWGYVHRIQELHERFMRFPQLDVDRALQDYAYPAEVARSLGYAARAHDYLDRNFRKQSREFFDKFERESGKYDLAGVIANTSRRDVVKRFGLEREAHAADAARAAEEKARKVEEKARATSEKQQQRQAG